MGLNATKLNLTVSPIPGSESIRFLAVFRILKFIKVLESKLYV